MTAGQLDKALQCEGGQEFVLAEARELASSLSQSMLSITGMFGSLSADKINKMAWLAPQYAEMLSFGQVRLSREDVLWVYRFHSEQGDEGILVPLVQYLRAGHSTLATKDNLNKFRSVTTLWALTIGIGRFRGWTEGEFGLRDHDAKLVAWVDGQRDMLAMVSAVLCGVPVLDVVANMAPLEVPRHL